MTLDEYVRERGGVRAKRELAQRAGLRWQTVHDIVRGAARPRVTTALAIERATDGAVRAVELLGLGERAA